MRRSLPSGLVTFLFTDIEGSTRLARLLGPAYRPVLVAHRRVLLRALTTYGGVPMFTEGDSLFVAFSDASDALAACLAAQLALAAHEWPAPHARPLVRMGLHTGFAKPVAGEYTSPEVHRAARISAAAHGGQILCSDATLKAASEIDDDMSLLDLGLHRLRGFDDHERLYQLVASGLERRFPHPRTLATSRHNLPGAVTTFVGRREERKVLAGLLGAHRLVNVVGPGGAGKTRLATETAADRIEDYPDGVWFTDLAAVTDPELVAVAVADTLGLRPEPGRPVVETVREFAADRRILLVLDTCDTQPAAVAQLVSQILAASLATRVLATSREPINLPGEVVWRIPPLSQTPGPDGLPSDAVALLLDRISASRGGIENTSGETAHLARVAQQVDGLPLALELAAARLRTMHAGELASRLDGSVDALDIGIEPRGDNAESRHATIQATVSWSYRTLAPEAAHLLRWMSVFAGRVDTIAVRWLIGRDPLALLSTLVDKSLVTVQPSADGTTYRMLDPIRGYAARLLSEQGEEVAAHERHVRWLRHEIAERATYTDGRGTPMSMYAVDPRADEIRAALGWSVNQGSVRDAFALASGLDQWWRERGLAREGRLWLFRAYERLAATGEQIPDTDLAEAYLMHSRHASADGEYAEALRFADRAEAAALRTADPGLVARVRSFRVVPVLDMGDASAAEAGCREVLAWAAKENVSHETIEAIYCLAELLWRRGALDEAAELLATARPIEAAQPCERGRRMIDMILGMVALSRGDLVAAHEHLLVTLRIRMSYGFHSGVCEAMHAVAARCALGGDQVTAARLFGAARTAQVRLRGANLLWAPYWAEQENRIRAALGDNAFDGVYGQGSALTLEEAVSIALAVPHPDLTEDSGRFMTVSGFTGPS